jgi:hypothetical protein
MAKANIIQTNFTSGEVSPDLYGRVDVNKYFNGAKTLQNMIVRPQGGAFRRAGTFFCKETKDSSKLSIVREFLFSNTQVYLLEFGDVYMRVFKITAPSTVQAEIVTPWGQADLAKLYFTQSADVLYVSHPSFQTRKISRTADASWSIALYAPFDGPYLDIDESTTTMRLSSISDTAILKAIAGTPFVIGDIGKYVEYKDENRWRLGLIAAYTSSSQVTITVLPNIFDPPDAARITFSSPDIESDLAAFSPQNVGYYTRAMFAGNAGNWYLTTGYTSTTKLPATLITPSAGNMVTYTYPSTLLKFMTHALTATLTASAATFASTDVGRWIRLQYGASVVQCKITAYTSTTVVTVSLEESPPRDRHDAVNFYNGLIADAWRIGAWSDTTGWPAVCGFHEQRLWFGNTAYQPVTIWGSKSGDYENMSPTETDLAVLADNAVTYTLAGNQANPIVWMETGPVMLVGTIGGEWQVKATNLNEPITPANIDMKEQTRWGSPYPMRPHRVGSATLFLQRGGKRVREMVYDFNLDSHVSKDVSIISNHMLVRGSLAIADISGIALERHHRSMLWVIMTDGTIATMSYDRDQEVIAWTMQKLGGTSVFVESICCLPAFTGGRDLIYMIVRRTINGSTKRYIERLNVDYDDVASPQAIDQIFVDSSVTKVGSFSTFDGLDHLNGERIQVLGDGEYLGEFTVAAGSVALGSTVARAHGGLKCPAIVQTLDPEGGSPAGTAAGKMKRINYLDLRVKNTANFKHGAALLKQQLRVTDEIDGIESKNIRLSAEQGFSREGSYYLYQDEPLGFNILSIMAHLSTNE